MNYPDLLLYWIKERYAIFQKKETGLPAPWSEDPIFQTTYFCNVHRENDRVTRWIRNAYSPWVDHPLFEYNIVLARFLNRISTLEAIGGFQVSHDPETLKYVLGSLAGEGAKIWGNAYVITTHGQKMDKLAYLVQVLDATHAHLEVIRAASRGVVVKGSFTVVPRCGTTAAVLQHIPGIGSFLSAQVVADLKNTPGHPLYSSTDRATFVQPGPGSLRGLGWFHGFKGKVVTPTNFDLMFGGVRKHVDANWPEGVPSVDNQDLQNCLCEFDKYCRVKNGTGRSKRNYKGA